MLTAPLAAKALRLAIGDYNYWPSSESDSPLAIKRTKTPVDEKKLLSIDASMRRKENPDEKAPDDRTIRIESLSSVFNPIVENAVNEMEMKIAEFKQNSTATSILKETEALEFYLQLFSIFNQLTEPKVAHIDSPKDALVGLVIYGMADGETVYGQALLVQT